MAIYMSLLLELVSEEGPHGFEVFVHPVPPVLNETRSMVKKFSAVLKRKVGPHAEVCAEGQSRKDGGRGWEYGAEQRKLERSDSSHLKCCRAKRPAWCTWVCELLLLRPARLAPLQPSPPPYFTPLPRPPPVHRSWQRQRSPRPKAAFTTWTFSSPCSPLMAPRWPLAWPLMAPTCPLPMPANWLQRSRRCPLSASFQALTYVLFCIFSSVITSRGVYGARWCDTEGAL